MVNFFSLFRFQELRRNLLGNDDLLMRRYGQLWDGEERYGVCVFVPVACVCGEVGKFG